MKGMDDDGEEDEWQVTEEDEGWRTFKRKRQMLPVRNTYFHKIFISILE